MKLQKKLLLSYLIVVLLPLLSTTYFLIDKITKETINQSVLISKINYEQLYDNVKNFLNTYTMLCDNISTETSLTQYLSNREPIDNDYASIYFPFYATSSNFNNKYILYSLTHLKISLYSNNPSILYDNELTKHIDEGVKNEKWYKDTMTSKELNSILTPFIDTSTGKYSIPITRIIDNSNGIVNIVKIDIPEALLWELIKKESATKNVYILNTAGYILTSTSRDLIGKNILNTGINTKASSNNEDLTSLNIFSKPLSVTFNKNPKTNYPRDLCRVITTIPSSIILGKTNEIIRFGAILFLVTFFIAMFFIMIFSSSLVSRLKQLVTNMSTIKEGNLDVYISYDGEDEIGELSRSFKSMLNRINTLISEVYTNTLRVKDLELDKKEARLQFLQSQMNPHFLFNTLESIRMNVLKNGDSETSEIIQSFGKLLRTSMEWKNHYIPLNQELDLVEKYLKIQSFRYRNRFSYSINISNELKNIYIPKFILQPIVENSIYHGVEMKKGNGTINIYGYIINNDMKIVIRDNGIGITKTKLSQLISSIENSESSGLGSSIGMRNVNQRLNLLYGNAYGINIYSKENKGTRIEIILPTDQKDVVNDV